MKFLSDILAKAGLTVDGVVTLNNTATGQTPAANDNSTKLATTAWVRTFVQPYSLPIASASLLGGIKVGSGLSIDSVTGVLSAVSNGTASIKSTQTFTATAGQTVFTISGGYTTGLIDVFLNGVYLSPNQTTATNGTTVTLGEAAAAGDIIDVIIASPVYQGASTTTDQLPEGVVNLYYTNTRARAAISLTVTGTSGASTYDSSTGVLNVPTYTLAGLGGVVSTRTITINGITYDLTANRSWSALPVGGTAGQLLAKVDGADYNAQWINEAPAASYTSQIKHQVKASQAITKGQAVYVSSADGTNMIVSKASNAAEGTSSKTMGLLESTVSTNGFTNVIAEGLLSGLNTGSANAGDPVWLGTNGDLIYGLLNKPSAPAHLVFIGVVTRANTNNGEIFVKVQNGFELEELHNVSAQSPSDGDMIKYVASTGLWTKIAASTTNIVEGINLYYTQSRFNTAFSGKSTTDLTEGTNLYYTQSRFDTAFAAKSTSNLTEGTNLYYTQARFDTAFAAKSTTNLTEGTNLYYTTTRVNSDFDTRLATKSTTNLAEGTNLYYTDTRVGTYLTNNSYATQTYVNTAVSNLVDAAPGTLDTLNELAAALGDDPNFATTVATSIGTKVPNTRTITINGTAYDLSADRSWTINSMVYPGAGIAVSTGSAWGTSITNNSTNWNTAYGWGNHASAGYLTGITSSQVTTALGYIPYNSTNPSGYISSYTETDTLASVTSRGASTSTRTTFVEVGVTKAGSDTVAAGPWFRWTNVAEDRQMLAQLNASNGLTYWSYNGSAWATAMTLSQVGALVLTSSLTASSIVKSGGTSSQFLKADGSVDSNSYVIGGPYLPLAGGTITGIVYGTGSGTSYLYSYGRIGLPNTGKILYNNGTGSNMFFGEIDTHIYGFTGNAYTDTPAISFNLALTRVGIGKSNPTVTLDVNGNIAASNFSGSSSGTNTGDQTNISGYAAMLNTSDTRAIAPSSHNSYRLTFGFTSWSNNSSPDWADYLHLRSYGDSSGGPDNLIMFKKSGIGMRIWQQTFGSSTNYSSYVDVLHSSNYSSYAVPTSRTITINGTAYDLSADRSWTVTAASAGYLTGGDSSAYMILYNSNSGDLNGYNTAGLYSSEYVGTTNRPVAQNGHWIQISDAGGTDVKTQWYYQSDGAGIYMRLQWGSGTWRNWRTLITDANYSSYSSFSGNISGNAINVTYDTSSSSGQGRFGGWYQGTGFTGLAAEIGVSSGKGYVLCYNRSTSSYANFGIEANAITIQSVNNTSIDLISYSNYKINFTGGDQINSYAGASGSTLYLNYINGSGAGVNMSAGKHTFDNSGNVYHSGNLNAPGGFNIGGVVKFRWGGNTTPTLGHDIGGSDTGNSLHIEVSDSDTGGLCIQNDGTTVYGAGDAGFVFRVIDEDSFQGGGGAEANTCFKVNQGAGGGGYMKGTFTATGDVVAYSDIRVKENIKPLTSALSKVLELNGYYYNRTDLKDKSTKIGFIAQEVEKVIPELVTYDSLQDRYAVSYGNATALLVEAIKEQQVQIEFQKTEIEELKDLVKQLINR